MQYHYINVNVNSTIKPSFFIGSTLRGSFGHLLKQNVCINPSYECSDCVHQKECLYYDYYESSEGYRPFRFDIRLDAKNYDFGFYIFGDSASKVRTIVQVLYRMLTSKVLTKERLSFPKCKIFLDGKQLHFDQKGTLLPFELFPQSLMTQKYHRDVVIKLMTPTLIKSANSKFKKDILIEDLLTSIYKRKSYFENNESVHSLNFTPSYTQISSNLYETKTTRRSDRQHRTVVLEGVTGELVLTDLDPESYNLLKWGEVLGVGNKTVFGHGVISIKT